MREYSLDPYTRQTSDGRRYLTRITRAHTDTSHAGVHRKMDLCIGMLTKSRCRKGRCLLDRKYRLCNTVPYDNIRLLRLRRSQNQDRRSKTCFSQLYSLTQHRNREVIRTLCHSLARHGYRSVPVSIRLNNRAKFCSICHTAFNCRNVMTQCAQIDFCPSSTI